MKFTLATVLAISACVSAAPSVEARDCRTVGFSCKNDAECCNDGENGAGNCMIPIEGQLGMCGAFSDCRIVDATCESDAECCSTSCVGTDAGPKYCRKAGVP